MSTESGQPPLGKVVAAGALVLALVAAALIFAFVPDEERVSEVVLIFSMDLTVIVGIAILFRSSNQRIGWLLVAMGALLLLAALGGRYTDYAYIHHPDLELPFRRTAAWFQGWVWYPAFGLIVGVFPQVFPTGAPLSVRWRLFLLGTLASIVLGAASIAFLSPTISTSAELVLPNPFLLPWIPPVFLEQTLALRTGLLGGPLILGPLGAFASLAIRYRGSPVIERQQIKWVVFALGLLAVTFALTFARGFVLETFGNAAEAVSIVIEWAGYVAILLLPLAIGVSILRYRLYGIDLLIKGSLVYGTLSVMLAAIYFGGVLLLQQLLTAESPIAVVLSTLAIAGLFSPLRRRLQVAIDKRFYRQQYDAGQALAGFVEELRDDVELEQISAALLSVVDRTILPTHVSLWLRVGGEEQNSGSHRAVPARHDVT